MGWNFENVLHHIFLEKKMKEIVHVCFCVKVYMDYVLIIFDIS